MKKLINFIFGFFNKKPYFVTVFKEEAAIGGINNFPAIDLQRKSDLDHIVFPKRVWLSTQIVDIKEIPVVSFPEPNLIITENYKSGKNPYVSSTKSIIEEQKAKQKASKESHSLAISALVSGNKS